MLANVAISTYISNDQIIPKFYSKGLEIISKTAVTKNDFKEKLRILAIDANRLDSVRTLNYTVMGTNVGANNDEFIEKRERFINKLVEPERLDLESQDLPDQHLAMLLNVYRYKKDPNYEDVGNKDIGKIQWNSNNGQVTKEGRIFIEKIKKEVLSKLTRPTKQAPYKWNAEQIYPTITINEKINLKCKDKEGKLVPLKDKYKRDVKIDITNYNFSDIIGAPVLYWSTKRHHIEQHLHTLQPKLTYLSDSLKAMKLRDKNMKRPDDMSDPKTDEEKDYIKTLAHLNKIKKEIAANNAKFTSLRVKMEDYLHRCVAYIIVRFKPDLIAIENLQTRSEGISGDFGRIIQSMFKNLNVFFEKIVKYAERSGDKDIQEVFKSVMDNDNIIKVHAAYTSRIVYECRLKSIADKLCYVDRRANYDWGTKIGEHILSSSSSSNINGKIYDFQINGSDNIALMGLRKYLERTEERPDLSKNRKN